jgi:hypothetical protein
MKELIKNILIISATGVLFFFVGLLFGRYQYFTEQYWRDVPLGKYDLVSKSKCEDEKMEAWADAFVTNLKIWEKLKDCPITEEDEEECQDCEEQEDFEQHGTYDFELYQYGSRNIQYFDDFTDYERGFNDALSCVMLFDLDFKLRGERKAWAEIAYVCRKRHNIVGDTFIFPNPPRMPKK